MIVCVKKNIDNLSVENYQMANTCVHPAGHFCYAARRQDRQGVPPFSAAPPSPPSVLAALTFAHLRTGTGRAGMTTQEEEKRN